MMRALLSVIALFCLAAPLRAQRSGGADLLARGISAAQNLDYDSSAILLRAALARTGADALPDSTRARALMFLGSTEFFRERRDSAVAAFGRLLFLDPRYRPDQLVFPPEISTLFNEVRSGTRAVAVVIPVVSEIAAAGDRVPVRLHSTSLHDISVTVQRAGAGALAIRTLYAGAIGDSLELLWDGRDAAGAIADSGAWVLRVAPRGARGRTVEVPLDVRVTRRDTLPWPPPMSDSLFRPEHSGGRGAPRALAAGLFAAAAVVVLPSVVSGGSEPTGGRYAVAAATGIAGVLGFSARRRPQPIPENIASNQALRLSWQRRLDTVKSENQTRLRDVRLVVRAGAQRVTP